MIKNEITITSTDINKILNDDFPTMVKDMVSGFVGALDLPYLQGLTGGGVAPDHDIGPWLRFGDTTSPWWGWDDRYNKYFPYPVAAGTTKAGDPDTVVLTGLISTARYSNCNLICPGEEHQFETLATTGDINRMIPHNINRSISDSGTTFNLNFNAHTRMVLEPTGNFSIDALGGKDGDQMDLWIKTPVNTPSDISVTWPDSWTVGPGVIPSTGAGQFKLTHIELSVVGNRTFVKFKESFNFGPGPSDNPINSNPPTVVSITSVSNSGIIDIEFSKLLTGGKKAASDFLATRNDLSNPIIDVKVTGVHVYVYTSQAYIAIDTGQVTYGGVTSIKDLSGNPAVPFGPSDIVMLSAGKVTQFSGTIGYSGQLPVGIERTD